MSRETKITLIFYGVLIALICGTDLFLCWPSSLVDIIEDVQPGVVHVTNNTMRWQGSGVAIDDQHILTARHVAKEGEEFTITLHDGTQVKATQAISSNRYDIGLIKVEKPILTPLPIGSVKQCRVGEKILIIGSPYGKINFNCVTTGIISGIDREWDFSDWSGNKYGWEVVFTSDAAAHPGNSGGPVLTMDGVVRGLLVGGFSPVLNCIVPVDLILDDISELKKMFIQNDYYFEKEQRSFEDEAALTFEKWAKEYF